MFGPPFVPLPVHQQGAFIHHLETIEAHIPRARDGIAGDDLGKGHEPAAVLRPAPEHRKAFQRGVFLLDDLLAGRPADQSRSRGYGPQDPE